MRKIIAVALLLILGACASVNSTEYTAKVENNLYRGSRQSDLSTLTQFRKIINLEETSEYTDAERQYAVDHVITWRHYPLSESPLTPPTVDELREIVYEIQRDPDIATYVHCRRGKDRTGYVIAAYRILVDGWEIDAAYEEAKKYGHASFYYTGWKRVLYALKDGGAI